jgi:hypothetical protein
MVRRAPQMGQVALVPEASGWRKVAHPLVVQSRRPPVVVRRMRRRADAPKLPLLKLVRGCIDRKPSMWCLPAGFRAAGG